MAEKLLYADTSIWNELCDQRTDPSPLRSDLKRGGFQLALGMNVFYEMVKTFGNPNGASRGVTLFRYLKSWLDSGVVVIRQTPEILASEIRCCAGEQRNVNPTIESADSRRLAVEVDYLAAGTFGPPAQQFIDLRKATARNARAQMSDHVQARPELRSRLCGIELGELPGWIADEATSVRGVNLLAGHVMHVIPDIEMDEAVSLAGKLLRSSVYRHSCGAAST